MRQGRGEVAQRLVERGVARVVDPRETLESVEQPHHLFAVVPDLLRELLILPGPCLVQRAPERLLGPAELVDGVRAHARPPRPTRRRRIMAATMNRCRSLSAFTFTPVISRSASSPGIKANPATAT